MFTKSPDFNIHTTDYACSPFARSLVSLSRPPVNIRAGDSERLSPPPPVTPHDGTDIRTNRKHNGPHHRVDNREGETSRRVNVVASWRYDRRLNEPSGRGEGMYGHDIIEGIAAWDASAEAVDAAPVIVQHETGTREEWLARAVKALTPIVDDICGEILPPMPIVRVGVGFPSAGQRSQVRGECWVRRMARDGVNEIIMRVTLEANVVDILGTLTHEMMHAALDCEDGHSGRFAKACKVFGFLRATDSLDKTPECVERLQAIADSLGTYPGLTGLQEWNAGIGLTTLGTAGRGSIKAPKGPRVTSGPAKQGTRMVKCECDICGFVFRTTRKWLARPAGVRCPDDACSGYMRFDIEDGEDDAD